MGKKFGDRHPGHLASIPIDPQFGYSQNAYLGYVNESPQWRVLKMSGVAAPARTFYFAEENMWVMNKTQPDYNGQKYRENISRAVLNDTALLARWSPKSKDSYDDAFATFHSPPQNDYNEGTGLYYFIMEVTVNEECINLINDGGAGRGCERRLCVGFAVGDRRKWLKSLRV